MAKTLIVFYDDFEEEAVLLKDALDNEIRNVLNETDNYDVIVRTVLRESYVPERYSEDIVKDINIWKTKYDKVKILIDLCLLEDIFVDYPSGAHLVEMLDNRVNALSDFLSVYIITNKVLGGSDYDKDIDDRLRKKVNNFTYMGILEKPFYYDDNGPHISDRFSGTQRYVDIIPHEFLQSKDDLAFKYAILKGEKQ